MENKTKEITEIARIQSLIFTVRGLQVMIDFHLAELYGVQTKRLNEQVKRNIKRFPESFMFQLTETEWKEIQEKISNDSHTNLRSQNATAKRRTHAFLFLQNRVLQCFLPYCMLR